jgi:23S rRNA pseudouridine1911/1915/1917 synthase
VRVNGRVVRDGRASVAPADAVELAPHGQPVFPDALHRVHEDEDLVVVDKPPGLLTIATERERHRTAYRLLWAYLAAQHPPRRPFVVHRLDRETSGLLLVAKSPAAKRHLQAQFEAGTVERAYVAVVDGLVRAERGTIESTLVQDRSLRVRSTRARGTRAGRGVTARRAVTHYRVLELRRDATLLELVLGTGRRRQIRAQLAALGHPIVGDVAAGSRRSPIGRLCLHATRLGFVHPATGARLRFESPVPAAFARVGRGRPGPSGPRMPVDKRGPPVVLR